MIGGISILIRLILTAGLLVGVYSETGIWTTLTLGLVAVSIELEAAIWRKTAGDES